MKLSSSLILFFGVASAAKFSKCPAIEAHKNENPKGPKCEVSTCVRRCKEGYEAQKPKKASCIKNENGKFKWDKELGGCKKAAATTDEAPADSGADAPTCKDLQLKNGQIKSGVEAAYKINGKGLRVATLTCPEGSSFGKKSVKKLTCKCSQKTGKCKWKNEKNKKITKVTYQKYKCTTSDAGSDADKPTDKPDGGNDDKPEGDNCPKCTDLQKQGLKRHNQLRKLHGSPSMVMTEALNAAAQAYAEEIAANDQMAHATNLQELGQGENLAWAWGSNGAKADYASSTQQWYNEIDDPGYDFSNQGFTSGTGHFTQVVWVKSTELGMGHAMSPDGKAVYTVARYAPAGNFLGQFEDNVPPLE
jgi:uncharacterized protein YkwD